MTVDSATAAPGTGAAGAQPPGGRADALGRDAFLQLLVTKLKNQDPTNPASDTEFLAQLAQFSALEQLMQINSTVTLLAEQIAALTGAGAPAPSAAAPEGKA